MNAIDGMACATPGCDNRGKPGLNIVGYGSFATKSGRRRRYRCTALVHESERARNDPNPQFLHRPIPYDTGLPRAVI
jgi:hypothetical protein